jgi:hypothetical protein
MRKQTFQRKYKKYTKLQINYICKIQVGFTVARNRSSLYKAKTIAKAGLGTTAEFNYKWIYYWNLEGNNLKERDTGSYLSQNRLRKNLRLKVVTIVGHWVDERAERLGSDTLTILHHPTKVNRSSHLPPAALGRITMIR